MTRLTEFSHGAGCACKLGPDALTEVLGRLAVAADPRLLVGVGTGDDAAVWRLDHDTAIVFTADFFTPIVDDAFDWGRIAAANALSDVYAMGGKPILALNIAAWPATGGRDGTAALPLELLGRVLEGGASIVQSAGAFLAGGHTIDDPEPKYGMAAVGLVHPDRVVTNAAARPGDILVLTKPIGTGIVATALKRGAAGPDVVEAATGVMTTLNAGAAEAMVVAGVRAATDVTGFGLLGHLHRMLNASGAAASIDSSRVPVIDGAAALAAQGMVSGGTQRNLAYVNPHMKWGNAGDVTRALLADAQTSGGLLICCPPAALAMLRSELAARGVPWAEIGSIEDGPAGAIVVDAVE